MEKQQHFSIRKLSIGAASVLIGISFLGVKASTVKADSLQNASETELAKPKVANEVIKQNADSNIKQDDDSNIKQEPASKTDAKQITADQSNTAQVPAKQVTPKPNSDQQNTVATETKPQVPVKVKLQANNAIKPEEVDHNEVETTTLMTTANKKLNAQMLSESKVISQTDNTNDAFALDPKNGLHEHANVNDNGGYDEDYWGKINIDDWNYTVIGDRIKINGYKGKNPVSLIIPNGADFGFINGQDTNNSRVYISSNVMHNLAKNATRIGLSKTANNKVFASDAIWSDAFGGMTNKPGTTDNAYGGIKYGSSNLTQMDLHNLDTSAITDMSALFNGGSNLTTVGDLSNWDTSNVTNMRIMFQEASSLTNIGNLDNWDTSNVTDMTSMFSDACNLTNIGDLSKWQTGNVTNMDSMFYNVTNLTNIGDLSKWDTNNVTDMKWMFGTDYDKQSHLTSIGDLSKWQTANVTDMNNMFINATCLTNIGDLSKWDTSKVTDMHNMFTNATNLTNIGDLSKWQTGNVTDMHDMFYNTTSLTNIGDLSKWDTSKVTDMHDMFTNAANLTNIGDLSKWQTGNVTDMHDMFINAKALRHLNISNWNLSKLANKDSMKYMFANDINLTVIANDLKLPDWYQNEINDADSFWDNHMAVITNVPELIKATGDIDNLKIDDQDASRSIFYDSKGSSDAIKVLTDANNQYIADYHKSNPTKALKLADTVDRNDPIALANASFVTVHKEFNLTVHFEDVDPNADQDSDTVKQELAKTVELSGHKGDAADLSQVQLPTNFELSGDLPSATFGDTDSVTIQLKHKLSDDNKPFHQDNGDADTRTNIIAPDGTVLIHGETHIQSLIDQRQDLVTGKMVNIDIRWLYKAYSHTNVSSDILNKYIEQYNPAIGDGDYTSIESWYSVIGASLQQPLQIKLKAGYVAYFNPELWQDWTNNDTHTWIGLRAASDWNTAQQLNNYYTDAVQIVPLDQAVHYQFMDNGTQIGSDVIVTGKTDETVSTNLSIPENYELVDGTTLPTSYTFAATNPTIQINLKHKTETSVESLPATRTINVHLPNGTTKVYQQIIGYQRDVITDLVTKMVTRSTWTMNDATSSFTIDGIKQLEHSYVLKNGNYNFASIKLPKIPGYKAVVRTVTSPINPASTLFAVSFMALPKPVTLSPNNVKPDKTVTPAISMTTEVAASVKTEPKVTISATPKTIDLSNDVVTATPKVIEPSNDEATIAPKETTWQVANKLEQDTYRVSNGKYTVELPHISNAQLHIITSDSTKDSILFTYKGQKAQYVFKVKFANGHYLLTTYKIKSGKLIKLIDYNFIKSSKMSDFIKNWLNL